MEVAMKKLSVILIVILFISSVCFAGSWAPYFPNSGDYKIGTWEQEKNTLFDMDVPVHLAAYSLVYLEWLAVQVMFGKVLAILLVRALSMSLHFTPYVIGEILVSLAVNLGR